MSQTTTRTGHGVFAVIVTHDHHLLRSADRALRARFGNRVANEMRVIEANRAYVKLSEHDDFGDAVDAWQALDDKRRAGLLPQVEYLAVRSLADPDPRWHDAPSRPNLHVALSGTPRRDRVAAAKEYAASVGTHGKQGGWIYTADGAVIVQGWWSYAAMCERRGRVFLHDGHWYAAQR